MRILIISFIFIFCSSFIIKPTTKIVKENRKVSVFNTIETNSSIDVYIKQGDKESVIVETNEEYQKQVLISVTDKNLIIKTKGSIINPDKFNVYIVVKELYDIKSSGSGDVESLEKLNFQKISLKTIGSGDIDLDLNSKNVSINIEGSGDVELTGIINDLNIDISGSGDVEIGSINYNKVLANNKASGDIKLLGSAKLFSLNNSGSGDIECASFKVKEAHVSSKGSGDIQLHVDAILNLVLSGSGDFKLIGDPATKNIKVTGSGNFY